MSFIQLFVLLTLDLSFLKHRIQDIQSFQHHALPWKRLQFLLETDYNHPGHQLHLPPPLSTPKLSATIPLTHTMSVVGYISNKHPNCYVWQSGLFEEGSYVVLGTMYRKAKIVGRMEWERII